MLISTIQAAARISTEYGRNCSQSKILHAISTGKIIPVRVGGRFKFHDEQLPGIAELFPPRNLEQTAA